MLVFLREYTNLVPRLFPLCEDAEESLETRFEIYLHDKHRGQISSACENNREKVCAKNDRKKIKDKDSVYYKETTERRE